MYNKYTTPYINWGNELSVYVSSYAAQYRIFDSGLLKALYTLLPS